MENWFDGDEFGEEFGEDDDEEGCGDDEVGKYLGENVEGLILRRR